MFRRNSRRCTTWTVPGGPPTSSMEGRIIRQGNENDEVDIYTYVTENTFDSYLYQLVEGKQKFIGQIMTSKARCARRRTSTKPPCPMRRSRPSAPAISHQGEDGPGPLMCSASGS